MSRTSMRCPRSSEFPSMNKGSPDGSAILWTRTGIGCALPHGSADHRPRDERTPGARTNQTLGAEDPRLLGADLLVVEDARLAKPGEALESLEAEVVRGPV